MLAKLASHYWRPDFSPAQAASMTADYADDLGDCTIPEIEIAIIEYRRDPANQFFPKSAQLRAIIAANRKHRADLDRIGPPITSVQNRPICWWMKPRALWQPHWRESDVPAGELVRDKHTGQLRQPERVI